MKKIFLLLAAGLLLAACGDDAGERAAKVRRQQFIADSLALKVAVTPTLDCLPLYLAEQEGWFEREGVSVQLRPYTAQMDQDTALLRQRVEGMTTDRVRLDWIREQGGRVREVATTSLKWQLLTNKTARIKLLHQLDDKMVAMTRRSATDMLARRFIDSVKLLPERVFRIQVNDVSVRLSMLENGIMDAMLLPEPQATQARLQGHPALLDTDSMGLRLGVIVFTEQAMADTMRQRQVEQFLKVYQMACDTLAARGMKPYRELIAATCHVRPETADSLPAFSFRPSLSSTPQSKNAQPTNPKH
ncbi:MAG: ABC transporter substrate-binding protein [Prevotella sp.]|nr:ABC transporter substrate-binding protein [Prevotella sp.]